MERRNTIQKSLVYEAVQNLHNHVTADEIYHLIVKNHPSIGRGTVYRNLNILAEDGAIKKVIIPNSPDRYDHRLDHHYHVKCVKCGKIFDVDVNEDEDLTTKVKDKMGIKFFAYDIIFEGLCPKCQEGEENG